MAYLILSTDGQEWDRRELKGPLTLGRSAECDIAVHDILLSRRHCRFTPMEKGWLVIDLASRNGTVVGDRVVQERKLKNGDVIRVGKMKVTFRAEAFVPAKATSRRPAVPPAIQRLDDTLSGTVFDLSFSERSVPARPPVSPSRRPTPKPRPRDPESFESDNLYSMLEQIASSSWDSIYAVNAQPLRRARSIPTPMIAGQPRVRPSRPQVSIMLQANASDRIIAPAAPAPTPAMPSRRFGRFGRWISRVGVLRLF